MPVMMYLFDMKETASNCKYAVSRAQLHALMQMDFAFAHKKKCEIINYTWVMGSDQR